MRNLARVISVSLATAALLVALSAPVAAGDYPMPPPPPPPPPTL